MINRNHFMHKNSIYKEFILLVVILPLCLFLLTLVGSLYSYKNFLKYNEEIILADADDVHEIFISSINSFVNFSKILGNKLYVLDNANPKEISNLLNSVISYTKIDKYSDNILTISFVDSNGYRIADNFDEESIYQVEPNENELFLHKSTLKEPHKLFFSLSAPKLPDKNFPENLFLGFGIKNHEGEFLGTVICSYNLTRATREIERFLNSEDKSFSIISDKFDVIASSSNNKENDNKLSNDQIKTLKNIGLKTGMLQNTIELNNSIYSYFIKLDDYPFYILIGEKEYIFAQKFQQLAYPQIIQTFTLGLFLIIILFLFYKRLVSPIIFLSDATKKLSAGEIVQIPTSNNYEISLLSEALESLQEVHYLLKTDLVKKTMHLEKALAAKSEFLNNISHEVRIPLQGILGVALELVENWYKYTEEEKLKYCNLITTSSNRLMSLMHNILDLATYNSGDMLFSMKLNDIKSIIEETQLKMSHLINDKNIKIISRVEKNSDTRTMCDKDKMQQVIENLLENALEYSPHSSIININIHQNDTEILFSIQDQGVGISEDDLEAIFLPFTQSSKTKTGAGGTGLGLAIVDEIIKHHNGTVWAENNQNEVGAKFTFSIPYIKNVNKMPFDLFQKNISNKIIQHKLKILLVDDEEICLSSTSMILKSLGYEVQTANGGKIALNYLNDNNDIDLILLDLMMPDLYGINVLEKIKSNSNLKNIPIIIHTGMNDENEINKAYQFGIDAHINKPYSKQMIHELILKIFPQAL